MQNNTEDSTTDPDILNDFFISYAIEDRRWAKWIHQQLEADGHHTIFPERDFSAGNNFVLEMRNALNASERMIAVISPAYLASPYTQAEWADVLRRDPTGEKGLLIPVFVASCEAGPLLGSLLRINLVGMIDKDEQHARKRLLQGVQDSPRMLSLATFPLSEDVSLPSSRIWNVPYSRNPHFTGRNELLHRLYQQLTSTEQNAPAKLGRVALTQPYAIKGLGGIGKTQIAVEFAYRSRELDIYTHTLWVNAASEETIISSFVTIAELLPVFAAKKETDQRKLVEAVKRWLEQCEQRWLLIFDNADNADDLLILQKYLPQRGNGSVLLTTRANAVGSLAVSIEVEKMGLMEGTQFLLQRAQRVDHASDEEINEATNVVIALDHFPLALDQAGAYIEETKCGFVDYLQIYQDHRRELHARRGFQTTNYPDSVATTWSLSFQKVEQANPAAAELLRLCAFLAPDKIPEELIRDGAAYWSPPLQQAVADLFTFNQMIEELLQFSLVKRLAEEHMLSIHRLVQAIQMDSLGPYVQRGWAERVIRAVNRVFPEASQDVATWPQCLRYLDQAQVCDTLIRHYLFSFPEAADLLRRTGLYFTEHASYSLAEPLYQRALAIRQQILGPEHPQVASLLRGLAGLYCDQGRYNEAESLYQQALRIFEQSLGAGHLQTATTLNNLASLYSEQGKYKEAEPLYRQALAIREQSLGPEHPDVASTLNNLASQYHKQGKYAAAEPLYQRVLAIREQCLGTEHLEVATVLNGLALLYKVQGKYVTAESLYLRALQIWKQSLGSGHPKVATALNNLADLYYEQGKYAEAEPLYRRALVIREQILGSEHSLVASTLDGLACLYYDQGKYVEAEPLYLRALCIREQSLGPAHSNVVSSLNNLALLYYAQGRYVEAEPLYHRALDISEQSLGPTHFYVASVLNGLAKLYKEQGKYTEAESLYLRALRILEQSLGPEHPRTQTVSRNYASLRQMMENKRKRRN